MLCSLAPTMDKLNKLVRSKTDRKIFGVCGGLAQATDSPPWIWRAGFVLSLPFGGFGAIAYLVLYNFMPSTPKDAA